jgi:hypothetical protein
MDLKTLSNRHIKYTGISGYAHKSEDEMGYVKL